MFCILKHSCRHCIISHKMFQSTRPHGARRGDLWHCGGRNRFNPRARTGRDYRRNFKPFRKAVSIHAPARGATKFHNSCRRGLHVSIHAPARGATSAAFLLAPLLLVSIHAPARGATLGGSFFRMRDQFQSTRPHGARLLLHNMFKIKTLATDFCEPNTFLIFFLKII